MVPTPAARRWIVQQTRHVPPGLPPHGIPTSKRCGISSEQPQVSILIVDAAGLTVHHTIEERHIFPILAKRMAMFQNDDVHLKSHEAIHHGQCRPS